MDMQKYISALDAQIHDFVRTGFTPHFDGLKDTFESEPLWRRLRQLGTDLWLDTGSIEDAQKLWTQEFSALTTNNTLLNKEVQSGIYDTLIAEAADLLAAFSGLNPKDKMLEIAFILNARHGLRLVERFDAYVSVEEHTDLANDVDKAVAYAHRYHAICPERFIIKIPFTPASLLATRRLSADGVPVNHTLGFSARQNFLIARIGRPKFVNVFLGRLNAFTADNGLGDGAYVGEKAALASQAAVSSLRRRGLTDSLQIGASLRAPAQVADLAGIDVMTMPPKVAAQFLHMGLEPDKITDRKAAQYNPGVKEGIDPTRVRLETLWDIDDDLVGCVQALEKEDVDSFTPQELVAFFEAYNCPDVLVRWSDSQVQTSRAEGKIPRLENWRDSLAGKSIGLDSLMNLAGLNSFAADQQEMDDRVRKVLAGSGKNL